MVVTKWAVCTVLARTDWKAKVLGLYLSEEVKALTSVIVLVTCKTVELKTF